jgi:hypothetical protein
MAGALDSLAATVGHNRMENPLLPSISHPGANAAAKAPSPKFAICEPAQSAPSVHTVKDDRAFPGVGCISLRHGDDVAVVILGFNF